MFQFYIFIVQAPGIFRGSFIHHLFDNIYRENQSWRGETRRITVTGGEGWLFRRYFKCLY